MDALGRAGLDQPVAPLAVGLERATGVDDDVGPQGAELRAKVAVAVEHHGHEPGLGVSSALAIGLGFGERPAGDEQIKARLVLQQLNDASAEGAVAADDQKLHRDLPSQQLQEKCAAVFRSELRGNR